MNRWHKLTWGVVAAAVIGAHGGVEFYGQALAQPAPPIESPAEAVVESPAGTDDLDEALRQKVNAAGLRDLNQVIKLLESALDKGLAEEDTKFTEDLLSNSLMERATALMQVINMRSILEKGIQQIRHVVTSDLRRVLAYDDPPPTAHLMLAKLMALPGGIPHEARRSLDAFLAIEDVDSVQRADALILRCRLLKDPEKALADIDEAIELAPENDDYRIARAVLLRSHGQLEEALSAIELILQQNPQAANALILQGEVLRQLKRPDDALVSFDQATVLVPQAPGPFQHRGEIYREKGDFDRAAEQFSKVLELQPGVLSTLVQRAEAYLYGEKLDDALTDVEIVLKREKQIPAKFRLAAYRVRAEILSKMERLGEAIEQMERVSEAMPDLPELKLQLALYYLEDQQPRRAIVAYGDVIAVDGNHFFALRARGDAYLSIGKHPQAIADFDRALQLKPEDTSLLNNLAWVLATSPDDAVRDAVRAVEIATQACELTDYKMPHILSTLAAAYAESGKFETAVKWSQQAVDLNEDEAMVEALTGELASYQEGQPWREKQTIAEDGGATAEPLIDTPQATPQSVVQ